MQTMKPSSHMPPGFQAVTPYFLVDEPERLVAFVKAAFDAEEIEDQRALDSDGKLAHTALRIEGSVVEIGGAGDRWKPLTIGIHFFVSDVDAVYGRALKAGGTSLHGVMDQDYGERSCAVQDPCGNHWYIATYTGSKRQRPA